MTPYFLLRGFPVEVARVKRGQWTFSADKQQHCSVCDAALTPSRETAHPSYRNYAYSEVSMFVCGGFHQYHQCCDACAEEARAAIGVPYLDALKAALEDRA